MEKTVFAIASLFSFATTFPHQEFSFPEEYTREATLNSLHGLEQELDFLKKEPFITISLGENCFFANHLKEHGARIRSFPFDWDITPFPALYEIIKNDFKGLLNLENLAILAHENTVFNKHYGIKLNHDFDIKDWYDTPYGLIPKDNSSLEKYHTTLSYYQRRIARFYRVFTLDVPIYLFRRVIQSHEARLLHSLLKEKFPHANFKLICIQDKEHEPARNWSNMPAEIMYYRSDIIISYVFNIKNHLATQIFRDLNLLQKSEG